MVLGTISTNGRVIIPKEIRDKYHLKQGNKVHFIDYGDVISIIPVSDDPIEKTAGTLKGKKSLTKALLKARKEDKKLEK